MQVGASIGRLQEDAKAIKNDLSAAHSQHKSRQTSKILSDFEVTIHSADSLLVAFQHGINVCLSELSPFQHLVEPMVTLEATSGSLRNLKLILSLSRSDSRPDVATTLVGDRAGELTGRV